MKFKRIEHDDAFEGDVTIFWIDISDPPQELQDIAKEIDGCDYNPEAFGVCVNYSFAEKKFYVVVDLGETEDDRRNIFYIDRDGDKHWFETEIPQELVDHIFEECGKVVTARETKLEKRLAVYMESSAFQADLKCLVNDYRTQGLPVPPEEQLRKEAAAEARKCLEAMMACEEKGHLWGKKAGPENGISTITCHRCGAEKHLRL